MSRRYKIRTRIPILKCLSNRRWARYKITHCIFDLDGTLIDSEDVRQNVMREILAKYGLLYTPELQANTLGRTTEDVCKILVTDAEVPLSLAKCMQILEDKVSKKLTKCKLMPGVEKLIAHLCRHHVPIAIISTSTEEEVDLQLSAFANMRRLFHHEVAGGSDKFVQKLPPYPDLLLACVERFCTDWEYRKTLVFDDAPIGAQAARAAGMKIVLVQKIKLPKSVTKSANAVVPTLEEFKPEIFGFPKYSD